MKNFLLCLSVLYIVGCGTKTEPTAFLGVAPEMENTKTDTTFSANGDTIINTVTIHKVVKCDTSDYKDSVQSLRRYVPPPVVVVLPSGNLKFNYTSENADAVTKTGTNLLSNYNSLGKCCSYSITRSSDYARSGSFSTRFELNSTDKDVASSKRTEAARATTDEPILVERYYAISYYLTAEYVTDVAPELLTQWQSVKGVSPPLAIWTKNGNWEIAVFGADKFNLGSYAKSKWTDFILHVKWSAGSDGLIEIWKDGIKQPDIKGANTYAGYKTGNYMKNGIYKWPWAADKVAKYKSTTKKRVIYIDDVKIGSSFADVSTH